LLEFAQGALTQCSTSITFPIHIASSKNLTF
jgi:hypothetical protein